MSARHAIRFGVWAPHHGFFGSDHHPDDLPDASYRRNRAVVVEAEKLGFDATLIAQHTISPRDPEAEVLEAWTASAGIAEATSRIEIIAAIKPYLYNPGILAKLVTGIDQISEGRFGINLVSGWFVPEMKQLGLPILDHDTRYDYSAEWLRIVRNLLAGDTVSQSGDYVGVDGLILRPKPQRASGVPVYFGGESEPARVLAAEQADVYFINGRNLADTTALIADVVARPRTKAPLRFALSAFVIARETEAAAKAEFDHLLSLVADNNVGRLKAGTDAAVQMMKVNAGVPVVGSNGGTNAGLVGSYDQVADKIVAFRDAGIELFMLQFQPLAAEMRRFAEHVIPRVRERETAQLEAAQ
ncbi:LLM class flavin-dependent oxidoreductase [Mesorhizobium sp. ZC-5]|uniref:LLM class flavin-dependent oxidoreductase n=1 Tax=Mesorhizobium sp. ZC-5 TaxID=2986066 RepID=UPI0021E7D3BF|nr:LLM class flavin-dependent oxidoreductase [Mesorhizobium sp. ZC-5]MCV3242879.1 LLM class flavin-dependent oxidoreductase [Mesorhizobium sp. ZC-5]